MRDTAFPIHFDGREVNPSGIIPTELPFGVSHGSSRFIVDRDVVSVAGGRHEDESGRIEWREPMSRYVGLRRWVIDPATGKPPKRSGWLGRLIGRGAEHRDTAFVLVCLSHRDEPWMSVILHCRRGASERNIAAADALMDGFAALLQVSVEQPL